MSAERIDGTGSRAGDAGPESSALLRRLLLALVLLGSAGLALELLLLEHFEDLWQVVPLAVLGLGAAAALALWLRPRPVTVQAFRWAMATYLLAGIAGLVLHYQGNAEFEREMDSAAQGIDLAWRALRGATPALAPGALLQLGILGLILTVRHPALAARGAPSTDRTGGGRAPSAPSTEST